MSAGTVILLNGPSVSGKSSIQRCLQQRLPRPHLAMGIDSILCGMLPPRYFTGQEPDRHEVLWADATQDAAGRPLFPLHFGPAGRRVVSGMHHAIAAFARTGNDVIVDHILYEPDWIHEIAEVLSAVHAYLIGVRIPLDLLEERERARGTSPQGHARSHYDTVHAHGHYDLEVDTSRCSPEQCADEILRYLEAVPYPQALGSLRCPAEAG